ncbi:hypothetical protein ACRE_042420 [Hapsidospora chrysogenum ATCC 11550]|uniref:Uncharacterized protein n=1 Tax=Hapsidospora chrysogenum (strain ATCC 11550 / CBS 779.69 / DSM 880 / IAM 14645 / JCM 23072 / IMI 49137) TaxID=857340 RepID=A0A086T6G1_HAPC1|nr:hypothetical protein ACRE_042420 [Hapsidospora chrysogenum ATCC 11550]
MSLLRLPPETLVQIFDEIGSSFFREDLDRLTVCKQWFEFALPTFYKCITLSRETLRSLIASGGIIGTPSHPPPLSDSLETLDIELRGYYQLCTSSPREYLRLSNSSDGATTAPNEVPRQDPLETWQRDLNSDLSQLAVVAQQSPRLRTLRIRAWSSRSLLDSPEYYLQLPTIQTFLSVDNLSVLALDLSGSFLDSSGQQGDGRHICPAIGAVLCTLRTLHLRMRNICPDVLKPRDPISSLRLGVVVVNLSDDGPTRDNVGCSL